MNRKQRILLFLLATINFTHILDFMIMMPLGNFLMPHFRISPQYFSWIVAAYPVTAFFSGLVAAFVVDNFDRKRVLLFAYTGFILGTFACGLAPNAGLLLAARVFTGIFGGLIGAQVLSIVADVFPYQMRGRAMSSVFLAFSLASVFGVPFSLYLANLISWHAPFYFIGILGIALLPFLLRFLPSVAGHVVPLSERAKRDIWGTVRSMFRNRQQALALTLAGGLIFGHFLVVPFVNPYMQFNVGFTAAQTPLIYMVGGAFTLVTSPIIGRISDRYGKYRVFLVCLLLSLIPIFLITNMPDINFYLVLFIFGIWFTFSTGRNIPAQAMISTVVDPAERGRFMSFNSSFQQLFTGAASVVSGLIVREGGGGRILHYNWVGYLSITVVFGMLFIGRALARQQRLT